ncbi:helix-turn-helix transcriptional regulator [Pseudonocardia sp. NPDC046786]|uniref:helix-turn-helix transcriptional regulator n=1 Tax=Pseudonocardia sp. NPDC046786 TaxID=3155471 RepID=UPI003401ED11
MPERADAVLRQVPCGAGTLPADVVTRWVPVGGAQVQLVRTAWAHLLYGEWLWHRRRRTDARCELAAAQALFTQMGAPRFAERARTELAAAGAATRPAADRSIAGRPELTPREHRIARLAAAGSTNSEIAAEQVISANTIEHHLRKVFGKIGVRSRPELGAAGFVAREISRRAGCTAR